MTLEELNVKITAQNDQFKKQIDEVNKKLSGMNDQSSKVSKTLSSMFNLQLLTAGVRLLRSAYQSFARMSAGYFDKIEQETKLAEVMRQRMGATSGQVNAIKKLTEQEQALGVIEDDVLMAGLQQLGTFAKYPSTLSELNGAMANLIAQQKGYDAVAQDAVTIGNLMGKVLQGQTSALTRVGITFTEAQEEVLKYGNEQERAAMLAEVITDNVGNMNAALLNTPRGQLKQLQMNLDDIGDSLTEGILSPLMAAMPMINSVVSKGQTMAKYFSAIMQGLFGEIKNEPVLGAIKNNEDLADSIEDVKEAYQEGTSSIDEFNVASGFKDESASPVEPELPFDEIEDGAEETGNAIAEAVKPIVDFINNNKETILNIVKAVGFMVSPLTRVATVIGLIVGNLKSDPVLWERFTGMFESISSLGPVVAGLLASIGDSLSSVISKALEVTANYWEKLGPSILSILTAIGEALSVFILPVITKVIELVLPVFEIIALGLSTILDGLSRLGLLEPIIWGLVAGLVAWKTATLAAAAAQWIHNASLLAKIGLATMGVGLAVGAVVMASSSQMEAKGNSIPMYEDGHFGIDRGQMFIANENGAEMVGTIKGKTSVANNMQIVQGIAQGVKEAISEAYGENGGQTVTVKLDFNTSEAARILRPKLQYENNRIGGK